MKCHDSAIIVFFVRNNFLLLLADCAHTSLPSSAFFSPLIPKTIFFRVRVEPSEKKLNYEGFYDASKL